MKRPSFVSVCFVTAFSMAGGGSGFAQQSAQKQEQVQPPQAEAAKSEGMKPPDATEKSAVPKADSLKPYDIWTTKRLTGDWGGARTDLEKKGISFVLSYQQQFQQNFKGGLDTHNGQRLTGSYDLNLLLDFGKMGVLQDAGFFIRAAKGTWGDGINPDKVGALFNVNGDANGDHPIFVNKWWFWKKLCEKTIEIRLGLLQTNKDLFDVSPYANHEDKDFVNRLSIRNATIPHRNGIGVFLKYEPVDWLYFQAATLDAQHKVRKTGFSSAFHDEAWYAVFWEAGVKPKWESCNGKLPGNYRIGGWFDPTPKTIFRDTLGGRREAGTDSGDVGYYIGLDQMVWKENAESKDEQGLGIYARWGHAHADRNRVSNYWSTGLSYKGLIPSRDADVFGLGVAQAILSDRYGDEVHAGADRETAYEGYYAWQLTPWCIVSPHVQVVTNPGGDKDDRDAIVGGLRVRIFF